MRTMTYENPPVEVVADDQRNGRLSLCRHFGQLSPNHIDEVYMSEGHYGHRIAHGTLMMGLMSAASARLRLGRTVSLGYDRVRFTGPVSSETRSRQPTPWRGSIARSGVRTPTSNALISMARSWRWQPMCARGSTDER